MICISKCPECGKESLIDLGVLINKKTDKIVRIVEKEIINPEDFLESIRMNVREQILSGKNLAEIKTMLRDQYMLSDLCIEKMIEIILSEKRLIIKDNKFVYLVNPLNV